MSENQLLTNLTRHRPKSQRPLYFCKYRSIKSVVHIIIRSGSTSSEVWKATCFKIFWKTFWKLVIRLSLGKKWFWHKMFLMRQEALNTVYFLTSAWVEWGASSQVCKFTHFYVLYSATYTFILIYVYNMFIS